MSDIKEKLLAEMELHIGEAVKLNDFLADNPEISGKEYNSSKVMADMLRSHNIDVEYPFCDIDTAYIGRINADKKRRVAILAEYDALPEIGHGCGHCASGSASFLAAIALNELRDEIDYGIDIIGTPNEEVDGLKSLMADKGIFDNYEFAIMVHMGNCTTVDINFIALDGRYFQWTGAPAHAAAAPELGRNALNAARLFMDAIDMMRQHVPQETRMHGIISQGGVATNIVPDFAEVKFLARAPHNKDVIELYKWIEDCAKAAAMMTKTELKILPYGYPFADLHITHSGKNIMQECMNELGIDYIEGDGFMKGSSDIGNVDIVCPAFHPVMSINKPYAIHTREFANEMKTENGHTALKNASRLILTFINKLFNDPEKLSEIKREHYEYRKGDKI